ncbi:hypothetical protein B0T20DRAFT_204001 [Sordaria brevicollis]|uniref:Uncharacterized protein n=1 Tax=Sordaria brevicollis TaxID=83679 RepID=A0AAE0UBR7_SORBR|nr:hypothetical protein B0T20DRAFT_204001 [Sordaria brevicollis]
MRNFGVVALSGAALLQVASASCCRNNSCFKAVAMAENEGVEDCKANLIVTVTPSAPEASTVTETVTLVQSAVDTVLFTETTTEIASTETRILTETTTVTGATETNFLTEIVTVPYTTTVVSLLPEVTSTATSYQDDILTMKKVKARDTLTFISEADPLPTSSEASTSEVSTSADTFPALPTYASLVCADWAKYSKACKCVGVTATTVTLPAASAPPIETVTVTASDALTTVVSTLSSTVTDIISVTETVSDTETSTIGATELITATATLTTSAPVETVVSTSTAVSVVPLTCRPRNIPFRASTPFPDGSTRWMNSVSNTIVAWQSFASGTTGSGLYSSTWQVDANGMLEQVNVLPGQTQVLAMYVDATRTLETAQVLVRARSEVEAAVDQGRWARVKGCVNAATGELTMSTVRERRNILSCGNGLYMSSGDGKDVRSDCLVLRPVVA